MSLSVSYDKDVGTAFFRVKITIPSSDSIWCHIGPAKVYGNAALSTTPSSAFIRLTFGLRDSLSDWDSASVPGFLTPGRRNSKPSKKENTELNLKETLSGETRSNINCLLNWI